MKKKLIYIIVAVLVVLGVVIFIRVINSKNPLKVNISKIDLDIQLERFDLDFRDINFGDSYKKISELETKYGDFFDVYNEGIIGIVGINNSSYLTYVKTFFNDYSVVEAYKEVEAVYSGEKQINKDLTYAFKHLKYYYPDYSIPRFVSFVAGFNQSIVLLDDFIGIGLDKYLGADCKSYDMLDIPNYMRSEMTPEQIVVDIITAISKDRYQYQPETENLLNVMIYNGQILYFIDAMMPEFTEARKNKYSEQQMAFCQRYEKDIWTNLIENKLLFDTDYFTIRKFTENAPYTAQFGPDSPPRAVNWIGLQIVRSYMKHNKNVTLQELMEDTNYQKILNLSQYSPK